MAARRGAESATRGGVAGDERDPAIPPVLAAGMLRTPEQAQAALDLGLSLAVVGKGLVMNPDWVGLAQAGCAAQIRQELDLDERAALSIPDGLWRAVEAAPGWIPVRKTQTVACA